MTTNPTPDPLAYGPSGYRCGCGKAAHSNLVPCQSTPAPLSPEREAETREWAPGLAAAYTAWLDKFSPLHEDQQMADTVEVLLKRVPALLATLDAERAENARLLSERQETNGKLVELTVALRAAEKRIAELEPEPDQQRSALEALWQRWFVNAQQGVSFREFTEGLGGDLRAAIEGGGR